MTSDSRETPGSFEPSVILLPLFSLCFFQVLICSNYTIAFLNENDLIPFDTVKHVYDNRIAEITSASGVQDKTSRAGWYYQQFLKMEFHRICDSEYYLCWDADTIPLRRIDMFHPSGIPYLDIKAEFMPAYFDTIHKLFGFHKVIEQSFISEHMLFKRDFMAEMINEILLLTLEGNTFYEKILSAVCHPFNGFSEFETYGTWVALRHTGAYRLRHWKSLRNTNFLISRRDVTDEDLSWLSTGFDAASFERYQTTEPLLNELFLNPRYRQELTADQFYKTLLESGLFGNYENGTIIDGNNRWAV